MNVLVTGGAGYKGVKLVRKLLERNEKVTLLDNFMYGYDPVLHLLEYPNLTVVKHDVRNPIEDLHKYDIIFHLAGISGFPACAANPHSAQLINVDATKKIVDALGKGQVLINASTTSFYGKSGEKCDENSHIDPVSLYGITKYQAEKIVAEKPNTINLRFATVFGFSPKMRMDLMVNDFTYKAVKEGVVVLFDSYAKRTFLHIDDVVSCYLFTMDNADKMKGQIYNAGHDSLNYSKLEIAELVKKYVDYNVIDSAIKDKDVRHFLISFDKIKALGFKPEKTVEDGVREMARIFRFYDHFSHYKTI